MLENWDRYNLLDNVKKWHKNKFKKLLKCFLSSTQQFCFCY